MGAVRNCGCIGAVDRAGWLVPDARPYIPGATAGGGSGFALGPEENEFATATARNSYATANAAWLALYNGDRSLWIQVGGVTGAIQRRNAAGNDWETVTGLIRGRTGGPGAAGGGALEQYPTFARTSISAAEDDIWLDFGVDWDQSVEYMAFTRTGGNAFYWFRAAEIYGSPDSVSLGVIGAAPTAAQRYTVNDAGIGGAINLGIDAAGRALIEFTSSQSSPVSIIILKYISSDAQGGGLSAAQIAELARLSGVETDATQDQSGAEIKAAYEAEDDSNAYTDAEKTKLGGVAAGANLLIPYKIGNIYRAFATGAFVIKPGNTEGVVTESGISEAPVGWQLTRPEATEALPGVYDCHVYGYATNGVFSWQFGTPNRTDRYIAPGGGGGSPDTAAQVLAKLLTVDGAGSGLDADLLDGMTPAQVAALGGGGSFDLHDDVTTELTSLAASDRFLVSDENVTGDPNRWVSLTRLQAAILSINYLTVSLGLATQTRVGELIQNALAAAVTGNSETNITVVHNDDGTIDFAVIYPNQVTQAEAVDGTGVIARLWTPQRVAQAIAALAPGGQTTGLNQTQVDARVQAGLTAAVVGNTETGIVVTHNLDGTLDFVVSGGTPTQTHLNYVGIRVADTSVVAGDLTVNGMTAALALPAYTGAAHLIYSYPTAEGPPSAIYLYQDGHRNVQNQSSIFGITGTVQLGGEEHTWRVTDDAQTGFGGYILEQAR